MLDTYIPEARKKQKMEELYYPTSIGMLVLGATEKGVRSLRFEASATVPFTATKNIFLMEAARWLDGYFRGEKMAKPCVALDFEGSPTFDKMVWHFLLNIPHGKVMTYSEVALQLGKSKGASQAVGGAVGRNPIAILIPCHRVVGANGSLTGFAWGIERKEGLLKMENSDFYRKQPTLF